MAEKRYYWLKLREDFFNSKRIKKLRRVAGGDTYTIIYLKMQLKALRSDGYLYYDGLEESFAEELALDIDEEVDNVRMTINYLLTTGLMETSDSSEFLLPWVVESTGSETASAQRARDFRKRQKGQAEALQCNNKVTQALQCNATVTETQPPQNVEIEKEIEIEIELEKEIEIEIERESEREEESTQTTPKKKAKEPKHKYGEYGKVLLTDAERDKLIQDFGFEIYSAAVEFLDVYIAEKGYKSKSHYLAIRRWVIQAVKDRSRRASPVQKREEEMREAYDTMRRWAET